MSINVIHLVARSSPLRRDGCQTLTHKIHTYIHTYIHTHIHTYIHTHIHTYIHVLRRTEYVSDLGSNLHASDLAGNAQPADVGPLVCLVWPPVHVHAHVHLHGRVCVICS
jgi:hypothetical protein